MNFVGSQNTFSGGQPDSGQASLCLCDTAAMHTAAMHVGLQLRQTKVSTVAISGDRVLPQNDSSGGTLSTSLSC